MYSNPMCCGGKLSCPRTQRNDPARSGIRKSTDSTCLRLESEIAGSVVKRITYVDR